MNKPNQRERACSGVRKTRKHGGSFSFSTNKCTYNDPKRQILYYCHDDEEAFSLAPTRKVSHLFLLKKV
jgi:hypothetical protein